MPFRQKRGENTLVDPGYRTGKNTRGLSVCRHKAFGQHHIADPYGRSDRLRKSTHIDHLVALVDALEGRDRFSIVSELTVVIILDDIPFLLFSGPFDQPAPSADGKDHTGWILAGRRHIGEIRAALLQL